MPSPITGVGALIEQAPEGVSSLAREPEISALPLDLFGEEQPAARSVGRPEGARDAKTKALRALHQAHGFEDPALFLSRVYTTPVAKLAKQLGCKRKEALAAQLDAAKAVAKLIHGRTLDLAALGPGAELTFRVPMTGAAAQRAAGDDARVIEGTARVFNNLGDKGE